MFFGIGGCIVIGLVLTFVVASANFVAKWNEPRPPATRPHYQRLHRQVGDGGRPGHADDVELGGTFGVMVAMSWLFAYAYSISFIAGEVKRPDKTIILSNLFAILVPFVFMMWIAIVLYKTVGFQFLNASAWNDQNGPIKGFNMPYGTQLHRPGRVRHRHRRPGTRSSLAGFMGLSLRGLHPVVARALVPGLPAHPVRLGHGPHGPQVVHRHQPALGVAGQEPHPLLRPRRGAARPLLHAAHQPDAEHHASPACR